MNTIFSSEAIDWDELDAFVTKFPKYVDWKNISRIHNIRWTFIQKHADNLDWKIISSMRSNLNSLFMHQWINYIIWEEVTLNVQLTTEIIDEFHNVALNNVYLKWDLILRNMSINHELLREYDWKWTIHQWDYMSEMIFLQENFIRDYSENLNWDIMSGSQNMSVELLRDFADKVNWKKISYFQKINTEIFLEFRDKLDWVSIIIGNYKNEITFNLINLIDNITVIKKSINKFIKNGKRHPITNNKMILSERLRPLKNMMCLIKNFRENACKIQRQWKRSISNPEYKICRDILHRDFGLLISNNNL